jgi:hypothetical protein
LNRTFPLVIAGLDPAIHAALSIWSRSAWMRGSSPRMTKERAFNLTGICSNGEIATPVLDSVSRNSGYLLDSQQRFAPKFGIMRESAKRERMGKKKIP